ncbi:MAG: hypothetical protein GY936_06675 [Ignavibacteriae bacterium]|nr:hypothetical protein [Ignavibacteriota bacterium]
MDLQTRKISFVQDFLRLKNEDIISGLEKLLQKHKTMLYERNLNPMDLKQFNNQIDEAIEDSENDRIIDTNDLKSKFKKWT